VQKGDTRGWILLERTVPLKKIGKEEEKKRKKDFSHGQTQ